VAESVKVAPSVTVCGSPASATGARLTFLMVTFTVEMLVGATVPFFRGAVTVS